MLRMFNLIQNENMKIFRRVSTWIMIISLVVMVIGVAVIIKFVEPDPVNKADWKAELIQQNVDLKRNMTQPGMPKSSKDQFERMIKVNEYRVEHNMPPIEDKSLWGFVLGAKSLISLISLFTIIIGSSVVANEFSAGTIKLLLIRPVRRWKILISKYITTFTTALVMLAVLFGISFIVGGIFFSFEGLSQPYLAYSNGQVVESNIVLQTFTEYGLKCINMLMMVTLAFMISTVFRNSALAIGLGVFLLFSGSMVIAIFSRYDWVKYILFANTDLTQYIDGVPLVDGMTMTFSIAVLAVYFAIFNIISWTTFLKRDVAA